MLTLSQRAVRATLRGPATGLVPNRCHVLGPTIRAVNQSYSRKLTEAQTAPYSTSTFVAKRIIPKLSDNYDGLRTDAKRMLDTLHESCAWGSTPDGGMSMSFAV
jgi:hypothetical protein